VIPATSFLRLIPVERERTAPSSELRRLTQAMAQGDDEAWSYFHRAYGATLFRRLLAMTRGDDDLAKEALQRTYLRVAKHVRICDSEGMFESWLTTVARTALQDCWRRRRSFADLLFRKRQEPLEPPSDSAIERGLADVLDEALARIDVADRTLLEKKYFAGQDVRSLAEQMSLTAKAVESRLTRARAALRLEILAALQRHD
jgi:RNA polymerase sigma-70 factor (ECF subfamily)